MVDFPSLEWVQAYKDAINANDAYKAAGKDWTFGVVAMVVSADPAKWERSRKPLIEFIDSVKAPSPVQRYYRKETPWAYDWSPVAAWRKGLKMFFRGLKTPTERGPRTLQDLQMIAMKSAALAAENFVLGIVAQGGSTCMMEGFDEVRMKKLLNLPRTARVGMVIAVGYEGERATWGPRFRLPFEDVVRIL